MVGYSGHLSDYRMGGANRAIARFNCHLAESAERVEIIHPSQCINLPVPSLEFVLAASWDDAPLGRNNIIKAGPKQELKSRPTLRANTLAK